MNSSEIDKLVVEMFSKILGWFSYRTGTSFDARWGLKSTSGAQFAAVLLVKPVVWFAHAVVNWRSRSVAKSAQSLCWEMETIILLWVSFPGCSGGRARKGSCFYAYNTLIYTHPPSPPYPLFSGDLGTLSLGIPYHTCNATKVARETTVFFFFFFFKACNYVSGIWIFPLPIPLRLPVDWAVKFPTMYWNKRKSTQTLKKKRLK